MSAQEEHGPPLFTDRLEARGLAVEYKNPEENNQYPEQKWTVQEGEPQWGGYDKDGSWTLGWFYTIQKGRNEATRRKRVDENQLSRFGTRSAKAQKKEGEELHEAFIAQYATRSRTDEIAHRQRKNEHTTHTSPRNDVNDYSDHDFGCFRIGDRVRILRQPNSRYVYHGHLSGKYATVTDVIPDEGIKVRTDRWRYEAWEYRTLQPSQLEFSKHQLGDIVEYEWDRNGNMKQGTVEAIKGVWEPTRRLEYTIKDWKTGESVQKILNCDIAHLLPYRLHCCIQTPEPDSYITYKERADIEELEWFKAIYKRNGVPLDDSKLETLTEMIKQQSEQSEEEQSEWRTLKREWRTLKTAFCIMFQEADRFYVEGAGDDVQERVAEWMLKRCHINFDFDTYFAWVAQQPEGVKVVVTDADPTGDDVETEFPISQWLIDEDDNPQKEILPEDPEVSQAISNVPADINAEPAGNLNTIYE